MMLLGAAGIAIDFASGPARWVTLRMAIWWMVLVRPLWPPHWQIPIQQDWVSLPEFPVADAWWFISVWLTVAFVLIAIRVARHFHALRCLARREADGDVVRIASQLGIGIPVFRAFVSSPQLIGCVRPFIALPADMSDVRQIRSALAHEWTHYLRRDHISGILSRIFAYLAWPQPFALIAASRISALQEFACDRRAADSIGTSEYATQLGGMALTIGQRRPIGVAWATSGQQIIDRLRHIHWRESRWSKSLGVTAAVILCCVTAVQSAVQWQPIPGWGEAPGCLPQRLYILSQLAAQEEES